MTDAEKLRVRGRILRQLEKVDVERCNLEQLQAMLWAIGVVDRLSFEPVKCDG